MHRLRYVPLLTMILLMLSVVRAGAVRDVFQKVSSSVVVIQTEQHDVDPTVPGQLATVGGLGSGVLISDDGQVLTAAHVVQTANVIQVLFQDGQRITARVLASEPDADVALLQLDKRPKKAHVASLGNSDLVGVGDQIIVVGAPMGMTHSLTVGHISARRLDDEVFGGFFQAEMLQTDAAINQGNSGGPMFDMDGNVIGIVSHIISQSGGSEGLGFVMTSNMAKRLLLDQRSMWSGIQGIMLEGELARLLNVPQERAMLVQRVAEHSPASHLGIHGGAIRGNIEGIDLVLGGDIILEVMGVNLDDTDAREEIRKKLAALKSGEEMQVTVLRLGEIVELNNLFFPDLLLPKKPKK